MFLLLLKLIDDNERDGIWANEVSHPSKYIDLVQLFANKHHELRELKRLNEEPLSLRF